MQALFAYSLNDNTNIAKEEKKLTTSIDSCRTLYFYFLSLLNELKDYRLKKLEEAKMKNRPTAEDLNPNTRFVDNAILHLIENNKTIKSEWLNRKIHWTDEEDLIVRTYHELSATPFFQEYMENPNPSFEVDKRFVLQIIVDYFAENQHLHWFFEEKNVNWFDDYNQALSLLYNTITTFSLQKAEIKPFFKNEDDILFYKELFHKTIQHDNDFQQIIENKLEHWEMERVIGLDNLLMKMAMSEFIDFPSIPLKVSMNEYIEIAKEYSSRKSGSFINGLLDKIVADFISEGKIKKTGRGLIG